MALLWTQATVHTFDELAASGSVITDQGLVIAFDAAAWSAGPLRTMRTGQRVRVALDSKATPAVVVALTLATFPKLT